MEEHDNPGGLLPLLPLLFSLLLPSLFALLARRLPLAAAFVLSALLSMLPPMGNMARATRRSAQ